MPLIEKLLALYRVDQQLRGLTGRITSAERYLRAQQSKLSELLASKDELLSRQRQLKATVANNEAEIKGYDERVTHLRDQMNLAKTSKEYNAFLTEVSTFKADRGAIEEKTLEDMSRIESIEAEVASLDELIGDREKVKAVAEADLTQRQADAAERLAELRAERTEKLRGIPATPLAEYEHLLEDTDGEPMATIVEENRRRMEYSCGACYMALTAETCNALMVGEKLVCCHNCGVILYIENELADAIRK
ncbi:MAG: hypothetical protein KAS72_10825 [Phycisphaerales bacterium]|nr:hypothetical protein [Phycisphaerales bacterium]